MLGSRLELFDHEVQKPPETYAYRTTDPTQRDALQQQSFNEGTLFLRDKGIFWGADKRSATHFAAVILFAGMSVAIFLVPRRSTLGTYFSRDHRARSGLLFLRFDCGEE